MKKSEQFLERIDAIYGPRDQPRQPYAELCAKHATLIDEVKKYMVSVDTALPKGRKRLLCIEDLSAIGRGVFIGDYYHNKHGFVANITDDDPYGFVTHWMYLSELDNDSATS